MNANQQKISDNSLFSNAMEQFRSGRFSDAKKICKKILRSQPNNAHALNLIAVCFTKTDQADKALEPMQQAYALEPQNIEFQNNLASVCTLNITPMSKAIVAGKHDIPFLNQFAMLVKAVTLNQPRDDIDDIKQAVLVCLHNPQVENDHIIRAYLSLLMQSPVLKTILSLTHSDDFQFQLKQLEAGDISATLNDPFLLAGLREFANLGANYEAIMTLLRRYFLYAAPEVSVTCAPFLLALAEQCDLNEYVYDCTPDEDSKLDALNQKININARSPIDAEAMAAIALFSCYRGLAGMDCAADISAASQASGSDDFKALIRSQIDEPLQRESLKTEIPSLSSIKDDVSSTVRDQYEVNPYPRWKTIKAPRLTKAQISKGRGLEILVAGCGTGQELINLAHHYPQAQLTGIDLSLASLAYGKKKALELGVTNVDFMQADILELNKLGKSFDFITCGGVLHHMQDPLAGWRMLTSILKAEGVLKIELYSEIARQGVVLCRQWIEEQGLKPTPEDMRKLRQDIMAMDDENPLKNIQTYVDFSYMSMLRDLVFHVQEHRFTIPQIQSTLSDLDLSLISMSSKGDGVVEAYRSAYPDDPQLANLDNWHEFEEKNPGAFKTMYSFLCHKGLDKRPRPDWLFVR